MIVMELLLKELSENVLETLGKGQREAVYQRALSTALNRRGVFHRTQVDCPIMYMGECVGVGHADLVVDNLVVELKVLQRVPAGASDQLQKYVESLQRTEGRPFRGVVLNFNSLTGQVDMPSPQGVSPFFDPHSPMYSPCSKQVAFFQRGPLLNQ